MSSYQTNIPGAPGYAQANLLARRAYENAMTRLQQRRSQSLQRYGYTRDASGRLSVDPNNEYGGYQQMLRGDDQESHQLDRAQRATGWGAGSGYFGAQKDQLEHQQGGDQAEFGRGLTGELADIAGGEQGAAFERDQALYQAQQEAAREAIAQGNFNPANYEGIEVPYGEPAGPVNNRRNVHQSGKARLLKRARAERRRHRKRPRGRGH